MEVRRAELQELVEVRALLASRGWDQGFVPDQGPIYIAREQSIIGCLQVVDVGHGDVVLDIVLVAEPRRRQGMGTALVRAVMADQPQHLYVSCRQDAVPFYESLGFSMLRGGMESAPEAVKEFWTLAGNRAPLGMLNDRD